MARQKGRSFRAYSPAPSDARRIVEVIQSAHRCTGVRMRTPGLATSASPLHFIGRWTGVLTTAGRACAPLVRSLSFGPPPSGSVRRSGPAVPVQRQRNPRTRTGSVRLISLSSSTSAASLSERSRLPLPPPNPHLQKRSASPPFSSARNRVETSLCLFFRFPKPKALRKGVKHGKEDVQGGDDDRPPTVP